MARRRTAVRAAEFGRALREMRRPRPNVAQVVALLYEALIKGDDRAAYALGTWYVHGKHVRKDLRRGAELFRKASRSVPDAMYDLAVSCEKGMGVARDPRQAFRLYLKAARAGDAQSVYEVGRCLHWGIGTKQNRRRAEEFFDKAARRGVVD